ncbi:MAG: hypothetical protein ACU837_10005, partial [Gammaproteobacteria bacterium]
AANHSKAFDGPDIEFSLREEFEEEMLEPDAAVKIGIPGAREALEAAEAQKQAGADISILGFSAYVEDAISRYFDAVFLAVLGEAWYCHDTKALRLGAAQHDFPIHVFPK